MALAIDASTPAVATQTNGATATVAVASFTPPSGSLLLIEWAANSTSTPAQPTITDNLGAHLTYTLADWQSKADSPTKDGQSATWTAPIVTGAAMTVTVTNQATSGFREAALRVTVITGQHATQNGTHGKGGSASSGALAQSVTGTANGSQAFGAVSDWDAKGSMTAGTGCALNPASTGTGSPGGAFSYGFVKRSSADGTNGGSTTLNLTYGGTSTAISFTYIEIVPAAGSDLSANAENAAGTAAADNAQVLVSGQSEGPAGSGTANDAAAAVVANAEGPAGSGTANDATVTASAFPAAENATAAGAADNALASVAGQSGGPAGVGTAGDVGASVFAFAECATGSGAADNPAAQSGSNIFADAECATASAASDNPAADVTAAAENATSTGTAPAPGALVSSQAEQATGTGAAPDPTSILTSTAAAEVATGTGAADNALASVGGQPGNAASIGAANDPTPLAYSSTGAVAECAYGAGTAYAPVGVPERPGIYALNARAATYAQAGRPAATYAAGGRSADQTTGGTP